MKIKKILSLICSVSIMATSLFSCHAEENRIKVVFAGDEEVGKTQIVNAIADCNFKNEYEPTIGIRYKCKVHDNLKLDIWDTAGQMRFRSVSKAYFRNAGIMVICADLSNDSSLNSIESWVNDAKTLASINANIILVGNKLDIKNEYNANRLKLKAQELGISERNVILTSAKTCEGIESLENRIISISPSIIHKIELNHQGEIETELNHQRILDKIKKQEKIIKWSIGTALITGTIIGSNWIHKKYYQIKLNQ